MKKIIVSLTAASLIVASAVAADKGIDIVTTGQAALYYQSGTTNATGTANLFDKTVSKANVGVQLNLDADLKNDFTFGSQLTYLGTTGLEKNLVGNTMQNVGGVTTNTNIADEIALTQIYIAKKIANTTVKVGRQELPMALSPLAFSEDWNVFKNTFEAALVINTDIPNTTLVGAYVGKSNKHGDLTNFTDMAAKTDASATTATIAGTAYMATAQNKSLPMTTITASFYDMAKVGQNLLGTKDIGANAVWGDVAVADKSLPMGLSLGLQGGQINPNDSLFAKTSALGAKASIVPVSALTLTAAYTTVSGDDTKLNVAVKNVGTGVKTPLYTQMVANQDSIALDANTFMLKGAYSFGDYGTVIAQGSSTKAGKSNEMVRSNGNGNDFTDLELLYVVKAAGVDYLAGYIHQMYDTATVGSTTQADASDIVRVWARYNF
ncbi:MAG: hypothetical protein NTZ60_09385 [Campylobacterales bacterium]|nr:hypothetical protein [Campylobacterales bacterium]